MSGIPTEPHRPKERRIAHPEGRAIIFRKDNQLLCVSHHQPRGEQFLQSTSTSARRSLCMGLIVAQLMRTSDNYRACRCSSHVSG